MAKTEVDAQIAEIQKLLKEKKIVIGTKLTLKNLKLGKISKVFLSANCSDKTKDSVEYYAELSKAVVVELKYNNDELGTLCKKPFSISVLSAVK